MTQSLTEEGAGGAVRMGVGVLTGLAGRGVARADEGLVVGAVRDGEGTGAALVALGGAVRDGEGTGAAPVAVEVIVRPSGPANEAGAELPHAVSRAPARAAPHTARMEAYPDKGLMHRR